MRRFSRKLCQEKHLDVELVHISDSSLIEDVIANGELTPDTSQRVLAHLAAAEEAAADYIMVTCSSIGPAVDAAQGRLHKPLLRVDQPLADQAVRLGSKVGVVATLNTTLVPTTELIRRRAEAIGKEVEITAVVCQDAFQAFVDGETDRYDAVVIEAVQRLAQTVDVIVLAQASMAGAVAKIDAETLGVPVLSSPSLAVDYLATVL